MPDAIPEDRNVAHGPRREQPDNPDSPVEAGQFVDPWGVDCEYMDAVDLAGALSFPASDPPALTGIDRGSPARRPLQSGQGDTSAAA